MPRKRKLLILLLSFVLLAFILMTPLSDLGRFGSAYDRMPEQGEILDVAELNSFLSVWAEFMRKDVAGYKSQQLSLSSRGTADGFPPQLVRWLKRQGWSAERFFYDEQKIRELANIASLEENVESNRKLLKKLGKDAASGANLKNIITRQEEQLKLARVNPQELELIKANLYQVNMIMDGKAVLKN